MKNVRSCYPFIRGMVFALNESKPKEIRLVYNIIMNARVGGDLVIETCHSSTVDFGQYFHSKELYTYVVVTKGSDGGHFDDACEQCISALLQV